MGNRGSSASIFPASVTCTTAWLLEGTIDVSEVVVTRESVVSWAKLVQL